MLLAVVARREPTVLLVVGRLTGRRGVAVVGLLAVGRETGRLDAVRACVGRDVERLDGLDLR
ncbi:MAG: hypothetical protein FJ271_18730 [Planctomycetes bacterium]|nr:hypothetical protein [Planctomycetota bacterium]